MQPIKITPYDQCPIYQSERFTLRLVRDEDARDLLDCYSDQESAELFNSDNCSSDFRYQTVEEMSDCIRFWLEDYARRNYVRFSVVDKQTNKAVGTIEFFARQELYRPDTRIGLLRLDLTSSYENEAVIQEIIHLVETNFNEAFEVEGILTKAVPAAQQRVQALTRAGYQPVPEGAIVPYSHYYVKV